jgi:hypothetical protein
MCGSVKRGSVQYCTRDRHACHVKRFLARATNKLDALSFNSLVLRISNPEMDLYRCTTVIIIF